MDDKGEFSPQDWNVDENGVLCGPRESGNYGHNWFTVTHLTIPSFVTGIAGGCFKGCNNLSVVDIPDSVKWIGVEAFAGLERLYSIVIPGSVEIIYNQAFQDCKNLEEVTILDGVKTIKYMAFYHCSSDFKISIPASVTSLSEDFLVPKFGLHIGDITIDEGNTSYKVVDGNIYSYDGKTLVAAYVTDDNCSVKIPQGVTEIGDGAFQNCKNLRSVEIPDSVVKIGSGAFRGDSLYGSSLLSITIPASVSFIGRQAFDRCSDLKKIIFEDPMNWAFRKSDKKLVPVKDKILRDPVQARDFMAVSFKSKGYLYDIVKLTGKNSADAGL